MPRGPKRTPRPGVEPIDAGRPGRSLRLGAAPLYALIETHVLSGERLRGDDTTVPIHAKGKTETRRIWTYIRDDRPFGGPDARSANGRGRRSREREPVQRQPPKLPPAPALSASTSSGTAGRSMATNQMESQNRTFEAPLFEVFNRLFSIRPPSGARSLAACANRCRTRERKAGR
jgi:hypothetical protein